MSEAETVINSTSMALTDVPSPERVVPQQTLALGASSTLAAGCFSRPGRGRAAGGRGAASPGLVPPRPTRHRWLEGASSPALRRNARDPRARMQDAVLARPTRGAPTASSAGPRVTELPFVTTETSAGPLSIRTQRLSPAHRTGRAPLLAARGASARLLALLALDPTLARCVISPRGPLPRHRRRRGSTAGRARWPSLVGLAFLGGGVEGRERRRRFRRRPGRRADPGAKPGRGGADARARERAARPGLTCSSRSTGRASTSRFCEPAS